MSKMSDNGIDELFREKFKDFQEMPDEKVWDSISLSLDKRKNKKRILPIWWKLGGAAAVFVLGFYLLAPFGSGSEEGNTITFEENKVPLKQEGSREKIVKIDQSIEDTLVHTGTPSSKKYDQNTPNGVVHTDRINGTLGNKHTQATAPAVKVSENNSKGANTIPFTPVDQVVQNDNRKTESMERTPSRQNEDQVGENSVTAIENPTKKAQENGLPKKLGPTESNEINENGVADGKDKKSIFDEIEKREKEKQEAIAQKSNNKWSIGPSVAPVYFNAIGEGSPIHSNFASNGKTGKTNLSYGVVVSYELNKKLSLRSGVHKVDYGYNTNDVAFTAVVDPNSNAFIDNIDYDLASRNLSISSKKVAPDTGLANSDVVNALSASPTRNARMEQEFGYFEVPVELSYALLDRKFGINVIGGVSSLFLTDNAIVLASDGLQTEVGEANNINTVNFSTNIGLGVQYKFTQKLQLHVEPIFKYQLNTFSETAGNFNPFSVGVYSGINYKF